MKIRKGDLVEVVAGADRGRRASVMRVIHKKNQVVVEGVHQVYKHLRRDRKNPQGGRLQKEAPIDASNVLVVCAKCDAGVRVGYRVNEDGTKVRVCKKCQAQIGAAKSGK
jgi:large subunit ribosomal protein L24